IDSFQRAIEREPAYASAHYNLGNALKIVGRFDEAIEHYEQAFRIDPRHASSQGALGQTLIAMGRFHEAHAASLRCLEILPPGDPRRASAQEQVKQCAQLLALEPRLPAFLQGKERPANAGEAIQLAEICRTKKLYVAAARFYALVNEKAPSVL